MQFRLVAFFFVFLVIQNTAQELDLTLKIKPKDFDKNEKLSYQQILDSTMKKVIRYDSKTGASLYSALQKNFWSGAPLSTPLKLSEWRSRAPLSNALQNSNYIFFRINRKSSNLNLKECIMKWKIGNNK